MTYSIRQLSAARPGAILFTALSAAILPAAAHAESDAADSASRDVIVIGAPEPDANPNANVNAPFKVERSADDKFTEPLRDTPRTITAIPKEVIESIGATSFRDVVRSTPGVTLGTGEGGNAFGDRIFIRGFDARGDVYIDGLRDPGVASREVFAVEQIEVVKGPSGSYGGRGTTGGLVSLQSKRPMLDRDFAVVEAGVGTDDYYRATVDLNYRLSERFAVRVNGLYHMADVPGRNYVFSDRDGVEAAALWQPAEEFSIAADYYHYNLDGMSDYGIPFDTTTQRPYAGIADNFYGAIGRDFLKNGSDVGTMTLRYANDILSLKSTTRYGESKNYYVVSVPRAPRAVATPPSASDAAYGFTAGQLVVDTGTPQRRADTEALMHQSEATFRFGTGVISHTLVAGFELSHEKVTNRRYTLPATVEDSAGNIISTPSGFTRDLLNPNPVLGYSIPLTVNFDAQPSVADVKTASVYMIDTLKLGEQWQLLLGIRHDTIDIRLTGLSGSTSYDQSSHPSFFNYQAGLVYKPSTPVTLYASFATSSNPSGEQLDSTSPEYGGGLNAGNLEPERNKSYELGAKWEVAGDLLLTAAAFQIDKDNARENVGGGVYELVGKLRARGFELGAQGLVLPGVEVFGGFTYLDARITESNTAANVGKAFPNVPEYSASLLATWTIMPGVQIGGQAYYQSELHGGTTVAGTSTVPGYVRFDAVARWKPTANTELRVNVLNVADKRYYDAIYRSGSPFTYVAPGRSATLTGKITF